MATDPDTRWEYCNVEICPEEVADASTLTCGSPSLHQADYRGTLSTTKSGRTCQQCTSRPHMSTISSNIGLVMACHQTIAATHLGHLVVLGVTLLIQTRDGNFVM